MKVLIVLLLLVAGFQSFARTDSAHLEVIYGSDDRKDITQEKNRVLTDLADSTVALIAVTDFQNLTGGILHPFDSKNGEVNMLCSSERFYDQSSLGDCSGFLISSDLVATAAHCLIETPCEDQRIVFGYHESQNAQGGFPAAEVYSCTEVVVNDFTQNNEDFAILRLDRPVQNHRPLKIANQEPQAGDSLFTIGHPLGLPTKIAANASIRSMTPETFNADLDTYMGGSGSAIFNAQTNEVVGILSRGNTDFVQDFPNHCQRSIVCTDNECSGETATKASFLQDALSKYSAKFAIR